MKNEILNFKFKISNLKSSLLIYGKCFAFPTV